MKPLSLKGLIPIALSGLAIGLNPTSQTFKYNDLNSDQSKMSDSPLSGYLRQVQDNTYTYLIINNLFKDHYSKWLNKVMYLSSPQQITNDDDFKEIVKLGPNAVPFIVEELSKQPGYLVWALNSIFGFRISDNPNTTIVDASKKWIKFLSA